jgi:hypothetical protein
LKAIEIINKNDKIVSSKPLRRHKEPQGYIFIAAKMPHIVNENENNNYNKISYFIMPTKFFVIIL